MVRATDYDCWGQPNCLDGYSNVLSLNVPEPAHRYSNSVTVYHYSHIADLTLRITRFGGKRPYKVCWRLQSKARRCLSGRVDGYSWNSTAEDDVTVRLRGMSRRTTFTWYVRGRPVTKRTANTAAY